MSLEELREYDALTGLLTRHAAENKIKEVISKKGILLIGDLDNFKFINDRYGHLEGDECLKKAATMLKYMVRDNDIVGRIGGNEFILFFRGDFEDYHIEDFMKRIENRFRSSNKAPHSGLRLSISLGGALYEPGDTYETLYDRAYQVLLKVKNKKKSNSSNGPTQDNWQTDINQIKSDLVEQISIPGSFCQSYESFKTIYRFLERGLTRTDRKISVILLSIVDEKGQSSDFVSKESDMEILGNILQNALRLGDVYTRYSSNQYLVLAIDASSDDADNAIAKRIQETFNQGKHKQHVLVHYCYELQSAKVKSRIK